MIEKVWVFLGDGNRLSNIGELIINVKTSVMTIDVLITYAIILKTI